MSRPYLTAVNVNQTSWNSAPFWRESDLQLLKLIRQIQLKSSLIIQSHIFIFLKIIYIIINLKCNMKNNIELVIFFCSTHQLNILQAIFYFISLALNVTIVYHQVRKLSTKGEFIINFSDVKLCSYCEVCLYICMYLLYSHYSLGTVVALTYKITWFYMKKWVLAEKLN